MNLFYKCVSFLPVKLIFVAMKEVVRVRKIAAGVHHAHHHYHHGWFIMVIIGFVKGELCHFSIVIPLSIQTGGGMVSVRTAEIQIKLRFLIFWGRKMDGYILYFSEKMSSCIKQGW